MPTRKRVGRIEPRVISRRIWVVYSTNRQYCFLEEIKGGFFGPNHRCGCEACDPALALPMPRFTQPLGEEAEGQRKS